MYFAAPAAPGSFQKGRFHVLNDGLGGKPYSCGSYETMEAAQAQAEHLNTVNGFNCEADDDLPDDMRESLALLCL